MRSSASISDFISSKFIRPYCTFLNRKWACLVCLGIGLSASAGCGGGGGGGGSDNSTGVRVLHGAMDATPIDVSTSTTPNVIIQRGSFAANNDYAGLSEGQQIIHVTRAKSPNVLLGDFNVDVKSSQRYSLLFFGDNATFGLHTRLLDDTLPENGGEGVLLRVVDGVTGASALDVTVGEGSKPTAVAFGNASPYASTAVGPTQITVKRSSDGAVIASARVNLLEGEAYTFFVAGEVNYYVKGVLLTDK